MEAAERQQRKRKSRNSIFEVSDMDLSPEPEEPDEDEPNSKVSRSQEQIILSSGENNDEPNLTLNETVASEEIIVVDSSQSEELKLNSSLESNNVSTICIDDSQVLEEGEVTDEVKPYISITFLNKDASDLYKEKFCKFIQSFVELQISYQDDSTIKVNRDLNLNNEDWVVLDSTLCTPKKNVIDSKKRKKKKKQKELFVVDTNPNNGMGKINLKYTAKFEVNDITETSENDNKAKPPSSLCFNCGELHSLKDCMKPKNFRRIAANRQAFSDQKNKNVRYYVESEQKYSHLIPGQISSSLRKALGLKKDQIPHYIYKMRKLGYPPGWLEEAKIKDSELDMFDIHGNNLKTAKSNEVKGLDPEKIINYPGFNVPAERHYKDEYAYHRVPPFSEDCSKVKMIEYFEQQYVKAQDNFETEDMDLDTTNEAQMEHNKSINNVEQITSVNRVSSPSITYLEEQKSSLLEELQKVNQVATWSIPSDENTVSSLPEDKSAKAEEQVGSDVKETEDDSNSKSSTTNDSTKTDFISPVNLPLKSSVFGTPILKSTSPYNRLPNPDNFSKGVSAVIDFENLPNSTGKYEQMSEVLQKVRSKLKTLPNKT